VLDGAVLDIPSAMMRSGTGRIEVAAAQNIVLDSTVLRNPDGDTTLDKIFGASIYTAGKRMALPSGFAAPVNAAFGDEGGAIALRAGGDVVGVAEGQTKGNAFNWRYTLALPVDGTVLNVQMDDWMYLMNDRVMLNKARMTKLGVHLGDVTLSFARRT
jgi:hypothetical protein